MPRPHAASLCFGLAAVLWASPSGAVPGRALLTSGNYLSTGDVVLVDVVSGDRTTLVSGGDTYGPCFAPDGNRFAFWQAGSIKIADLDGANVLHLCDTYASTLKKQALTWTQDDKIYWSESGPEIYRVDVGTGQRELVFRSAYKDLHMVGVSMDGRRAAASAPDSWHVWGVDLDTLLEFDFSTGCMGSMSPNGLLVTHNGWNHQYAMVNRFADGSVETIFALPPGRIDFTNHRFSHHSNSTLLYTADYDNAYLYDLVSGTHHHLGQGTAWDFWPTGASLTNFHLSRASLFVTGNAARTPLPEHIVRVHNDGAGTLEPVALSISYSVGSDWLVASIHGTGNGQWISNSVDYQTLAAGTYVAEVEVSSVGAVNSPRSYEVHLRVPEQDQPLRINCGGRLQPVEGWLGDEWFALWGSARREDRPVSVLGVAAAAPEDVYATYRNNYIHGYDIPVPDGAHTLRVHSVRGAVSAINRDYYVEGELALPQFSYGAPPLEALVTDLDVVVQGGDGLQVDMLGAAESRVYALEVFPRDAENQAPVVEAGSSQEVHVGESAALSGLVSDDGLPAGLLDVLWSQSSGPGVAQLADSGAAATEVILPEQGVYRLQLWASDGELEATDIVDLTAVAAASNLPPVVDAGADQSVQLGSPAWLHGLATDDGLPSGTLSHEWRTDSGPGAAVFDDPLSLETTAFFPVAGEYQITLTASDGALQSSDSLLVQVADPPRPAIVVLQPNGGETWQVGSQQQIRWQASDLSDVAIRFSSDGGITWQIVAVSVDDSMPSWEDFAWVVPAEPSRNCLIMVEGYFGEARDVSDAPFEVALSSSADAGPAAPEDAATPDDGNGWGAADASGAEGGTSADPEGCGCRSFSEALPQTLIGLLLLCALRRRLPGSTAFRRAHEQSSGCCFLGCRTRPRPRRR